LRAIVRERVPRQGGGEVLLQEEGRFLPRLRQQRGGMPVLVLTKRLRESREVVLHRRDYQEPPRSGEIPPGAHQRQVVAERAIPPAPFPRDGPALTAGARAAAFDFHLRLVDRPRCHRLRTGLVLGDHRLEHYERESRRGVVLELPGVERQLARAFADGMRNNLAEITGREIDPIGLAHVRREVARQLPLEPIEVSFELRTHRWVD